MAFTEFVCPECGTTARSPKQLTPGTSVRCPKCAVVFKLPGEPAPPPASKPAPPPPQSKPKASPVQREAPAPASPPRPPKTAPKAPERSDSRHDDDGESSDRPRKPKKKKKEAAGSKMPLIIGGAVIGGLALVGIIVVVIVLATGGKSSSTQVASGTPGVSTSTQPLAAPPTRPAPSPARPAPTKPQPKEDPPDVLPTIAPGGSASVQDIYQYVLKSTALIINIMPEGIANGTGSVVDAEERLILTNHHVVAGAKTVVVLFPIYEKGSRVAERDKYMTILKDKLKSPEDLAVAEVLASDSLRDLALLRVQKLPAGTESLPMAKGLVNIGQTVHSVGNPGASDALWVYTQGAVRSVYRKKWRSSGAGGVTSHDAEVIETQSPTNPGDSGGPLVNDRGELVGVTQGGDVGAQLVSYFVSLNEARDFIERTYSRKFGKAWSPVARSPLRTRGAGAADLTTLITALDHKDAKIRATAARSLGELGPDAKIAIRRLLKSLQDSDELTSRTAAEALSKIGAPSRDDLPVLVDTLKEGKVEARRYAATAIGQIGPEAAASAQQLVLALNDEDERVRESLVRSLGSLGSSAKSTALPGLSKALQDSGKPVRIAAAAAMSILLTPPGNDDLPNFVTILKHQDAEARVFGARGLAKLGKQAKAAIVDLIEATKSTDSGVRREAIDALAAVGPDVKTAVPVYVAAAKDATDVGVRQSALSALALLGKDLAMEKEALAVVVEACKDKDNQVKKAGLGAIGKLGAVVGTAGAKDAMPGVIDALQAKEADVRDQALEAVAGLGPLARDAVPTLINMMEKQDVKLFQDRNNKVFMQESDEAFLDKIAKPLGKVGLPAVRPLLRALDTTNVNFGLFIGACRALGEVGPPAREALISLQVISSSNLPPPVCTEADRAIRKIRK